MSGPKRADVEAQLKAAQNGKRKCATLIADSEVRALLHQLRTADKLEIEAARVSHEASQALDGLTPELRNAAGEILSDVTFLVNEAANQARDAKVQGEEVRGLLDSAQNQARSAEATHNRATQALDSAQAALSAKGGHYLSAEMQQARGATQLFNQAEQELGEAARIRQQAAGRASDAIRRAEEAKATARSAVQRAQTLRAEAQKRVKAEEEARRITKEKQRQATLALNSARSALNSLRDSPHQKFRPGALAEMENLVNTAQSKLNSEQWDECVRQAKEIEKRGQRLIQEIAEAQREHERKRAESESHIQTLLSAIDGADGARIKQWADTPDAYAEAEKAAQSAREALKSEAWSEANSLSQNAQSKLTQAIESAARNQSQDEVRTEIGEAVMDVLEDLGFEVSSKNGSRSEPLRIKGQTPDAKGRGDFDVSIPLSGEVDFHVETPDGSTSCVAAVRELQDRLKARGVNWETTDWGHAQGAENAGGKVKRTVTQTEQTKIKQTR